MELEIKKNKDYKNMTARELGELYGMMCLFAYYPVFTTLKDGQIYYQIVNDNETIH